MSIELAIAILSMLLLAILVTIIVMQVQENEIKDSDLLGKMEILDKSMKSKSKENR